MRPRMKRHLVLISIVLFFLNVPFQGYKAFAESSKVTQTAGYVFATSTAVFTKPGKVNALVPLDSGRMLVGGSFVAIDGTSAIHSLAIMNNDGSLDNSFQVDENLKVYQVTDAAVQADGKIVIAG